MGGTGPIAVARGVIEAECLALERVGCRLGVTFVRAVELILASRGLLLVTGLGKSGLVGRKIAATMSSTGTRSTFLNTVDAVHGDLGVACDADVVLALSNSGETEEVCYVAELLKGRGLRIIAMVGHPGSKLGLGSDIELDVSVNREADPYNLVPSSSTVAMLGLGDALAISVMVERGFTEVDFARNHPGGSLGRRLRDGVVVPEWGRRGEGSGPG